MRLDDIRQHSGQVAHNIYPPTIIIYLLLPPRTSRCWSGPRRTRRRSRPCWTGASSSSRSPTWTGLPTDQTLHHQSASRWASIWFSLQLVIFPFYFSIYFKCTVCSVLYSTIRNSIELEDCQWNKSSKAEHIISILVRLIFSSNTKSKSS